MNEKSTAEGLPKPAKNSARALLASVVTAEISDMCTPRVNNVLILVLYSHSLVLVVAQNQSCVGMTWGRGKYKAIRMLQ